MGRELGEGRSLASLEGNPSADAAPSRLSHSAPLSPGRGTLAEKEMCTPNFNFEVGAMVASCLLFFPLELLLIPPSPPGPFAGSLKAAGLNMHRLLRPLPWGNFVKNRRNYHLKRYSHTLLEQELWLPSPATLSLSSLQINSGDFHGHCD